MRVVRKYKNRNMLVLLDVQDQKLWLEALKLYVEVNKKQDESDD